MSLRNQSLRSSVFAALVVAACALALLPAAVDARLAFKHCNHCLQLLEYVKNEAQCCSLYEYLWLQRQGDAFTAPKRTSDCLNVCRALEKTSSFYKTEENHAMPCILMDYCPAATAAAAAAAAAVGRSVAARNAQFQPLPTSIQRNLDAIQARSEQIELLANTGESCDEVGCTVVDSDTAAAAAATEQDESPQNEASEDVIDSTIAVENERQEVERLAKEEESEREAREQARRKKSLLRPPPPPPPPPLPPPPPPPPSIPPSPSSPTSHRPSSSNTITTRAAAAAAAAKQSKRTDNAASQVEASASLWTRLHTLLVPSESCDSLTWGVILLYVSVELYMDVALPSFTRFAFSDTAEATFGESALTILHYATRLCVFADFTRNAVIAYVGWRAIEAWSGGLGVAAAEATNVRLIDGNQFECNFQAFFAAILVSQLIVAAHALVDVAQRRTRALVQALQARSQLAEQFAFSSAHNILLFIAIIVTLPVPRHHRQQQQLSTAMFATALEQAHSITLLNALVLNALASLTQKLASIVSIYVPNAAVSTNSRAVRFYIDAARVVALAIFIRYKSHVASTTTADARTLVDFSNSPLLCALLYTWLVLAAIITMQRHR